MRQKKPTSQLPPYPKNSDVLINEGMTVDEFTLKIEMYGAELTVSGSSPEHLAHVVKSLNLVLGGLK